MTLKESLGQFHKWKDSGWSKSETPSSEALLVILKVADTQKWGLVREPIKIDKEKLK